MSWGRVETRGGLGGEGGSEARRGTVWGAGWRRDSGRARARVRGAPRRRLRRSAGSNAHNLASAGSEFTLSSSSVTIVVSRMTSDVWVEVRRVVRPPYPHTSPRAMRDFSIRAGDAVASAAMRERRLLLVGGRDDVARESSPTSARVSAGRSPWTASPRLRAPAPSTADASLDADRTVSAWVGVSPRFHIRRARADLDDPSASPGTPTRPPHHPLRPHPRARLAPARLDARFDNPSATAPSSSRPRRVDIVPVPASPTHPDVHPRDAPRLPREDLDPATPAWLDDHRHPRDATSSSPPGFGLWSPPSSSSSRGREHKSPDADDPFGDRYRTRRERRHGERYRREVVLVTAPSASADIVPRGAGRRRPRDGGYRDATTSGADRRSTAPSSFASRSRASRSARRPPDRLTFSAAMRAIETMEIRDGGASRRSRRARALLLGDDDVEDTGPDVRRGRGWVSDAASASASGSGSDDSDDLVDARVARRRAETARRRHGFMRHTSAPLSAPPSAPPALTGVGHPPSHRVESDFACVARASTRAARRRREFAANIGGEGTKAMTRAEERREKGVGYVAADAHVGTPSSVRKLTGREGAGRLALRR